MGNPGLPVYRGGTGGCAGRLREGGRYALLAGIRLCRLGRGDGRGKIVAGIKKFVGSCYTLTGPPFYYIKMFFCFKAFLRDFTRTG